MKTCKWWHIFFKKTNHHHERSTSYCGKYLWHEFDYSLDQCGICNKFTLNLLDFKNGKNIFLRTYDFSDITKTIDGAKK